MSEYNIITQKPKIPAQRFADLVLDIGTFLMSSGAHCGRVNSNVMRLAVSWGFDLTINPTFKGLLVSVRDKQDPSNTVTSYKESPSYNAHLNILTEISRLSWKVMDDNLSIDEVEEKFAAIKVKKGYNDYVIAIAVGLSCAGLCIFSFGDIYNAIIAFLGASIGFIFRIKVARMHFNDMIAISIAAFITTVISGLGRLYGIGEHPEAAMATAVLYLIPGVPLINCVIDLIEGYLLAAMNRALFAGFILLCIATGMTLCITLMGISNF